MPNNVNDDAPLGLPAPYVNQFQTLIAGSNIRVSFAESGPSGERSYRNAVVMSSSDALELVNQILEAVKEISPPKGNALFGSSILGDLPRLSSGNVPGGILAEIGKKRDV